MVRLSEPEHIEQKVHSSSSTLTFEMAKIEVISVKCVIRNPYILIFIKTDMISVCFCKELMGQVERFKRSNGRICGLR